MLKEPFLIRRPLIKFEGEHMCGFDDEIKALLGISESVQREP